MVLGFVLVAPAIAQADTPAAWLESGNPTLSAPDGLASQPLPPTVTGYVNIDCLPHKFITRPAIPLIQDEQSHEACAVRTEFGLVDPNGYIELNGTRTAGKLEAAVGTANQTIIPIPNSTTVAVLQNTSNGYKLHFYENLNHTISADKALDQSVTYKMPALPQRTLGDADGNDLYVRPETVGFSSNGKWMIVDSQYVSTLKVNLETYQVTPFQPPYTYSLGSKPNVHMAISDTGQYALSTASATFRLVDTSTCAPVPSHIYTYVACDSVDFNSYIYSQVAGYKRSWQPRFINEGLISFYANADSGSGNTVSRFRLTPPGVAIESQDYLALGDSFAAGQGTYNYYPETDTPENDCHLSPISYPYLIGQALSLDSYNSVSCSGAKIQDIVSYAQKPNSPANNTLGDLLPGKKPQLQYVADVNPNIVTVGVSGNDIGFGDIIRACVGFGTCFASYEDRTEIVNLINNNFDELVDMYTRIRMHVSPDSKIYALGYPRLAQDDGNCAVNVHLDNEEIKFSNLLIGYLNSVVSLAASRAGVTYVDSSEAFAGHKMCETASSDVAINALTLGSSPSNPIGPFAGESYHPNQLGHQLYKNKILEETSNFAASNPTPDISIDKPEPSDDLPILDVSHSGREVKQVEFAPDMSNELGIVGNSEAIQIDGSEYALVPGASYNLEMHSQPVNLGTFTADNLGNLNANITIPSIEAGFHTVHIYGQNMAGEDVDLYKTIYVAASSSDYDGDGVPNDSDSCPIVGQSGQDQDQDGIDDACDGFIDKAPEPPQPEPKPIHHMRLIFRNIRNILARSVLGKIILKLLFIIRR